MQWLSQLDVNAVLAAVLAILAYWHNHTFRVAVATDTLKPTASGGLGAALVTFVAVLACVLGLGLALPAGCHTPKDRAVANAETACAAQAIALAARIKATSPNETTGTIAISVAASEIPCALAALGAQPTIEVMPNGSGR